MRRTVLKTLAAAGLVLTALVMADAATTAARPMMDPISAGGSDACPVVTLAPDAHHGADRRVGAPRAAAMFLLLMPPRARLVALSR
jgi:hypothetical protein